MRRLILAGVLTTVLAGLILAGPARSHFQAALLLAEVLPQSPVKPLRAFGSEPRHERVRFETANGPAVGDLYVPTSRFGRISPNSRSGVVLGLGVQLPDEQNRQTLREFAETLAYLGFVVLWPRLEVIDVGAWQPEQPETFISGVRYLQGVEQVDAKRISLLGFSVGASISLVAAGQAEAGEEIRTLIFFGGYYDIFDYLVSLATGTQMVAGQITEWRPSDDAVRQVRAVLDESGANSVQHIFAAESREVAEEILRNAPAAEVDRLRRLNPATLLSGLRATVFILHDRGDPYVPYEQSLRLRDALPAELQGEFLLSELFEHAQPGGQLSWATSGEAVALFGFVVAVLQHL